MAEHGGKFGARRCTVPLQRFPITIGHVSFSEGTVLDTGAVRVEEGSAFHLPEAHIGMLKNHHTYHAGTHKGGLLTHYNTAVVIATYAIL